MLRLTAFVALTVIIFAAGLAVAYPASSPDRVIDKVSGPASTPHEIKTQTLAADTLVSLLADLGPGKFGNDAITQVITVKNASNSAGRACAREASIPLPVVVATDTCAEVCAADSFAAAMTCNSAAIATTDGDWIDTGETLPYRLTGDQCLCGISHAGAKVQARRQAR